MSEIDLTALSLGDLLRVHAGISDELRERGISRTGNNPCADFAEALVARAFNWTLNSNSNSGFDALADGQRIEIKARRLAKENSSRQVSALRRLETRPFDRLLGVVFNSRYDVLLAVDIPHAVVVDRSRFAAHTNSAIFFLRDDLRTVSGVIDVTEKLKMTARQMLAEPRS